MRRLLQWLRKTFRPGTDRNPAASARPRLEALEDRQLLAGRLTTAVLRDGTLVVNGTQGNDVIAVHQVNGRLQIDGLNPFRIGPVKRLSINALGGDDRIDLRARLAGQTAVTLPTTIYAGYGNDRVFGGAGRDTVYAGWGSDQAHGGPGNDTLIGGDGDDRLFGEAGIDRLDGGGGDDWLEAGSAGESAVGGWNAHRWTTGGTSFTDVKQGSIGTCCFLSALAGAARAGLDLSGRVEYLGNFTYRVQLFSPYGAHEARSLDVAFDGTEAWGDPQTTFEGEFWTVLYQRAYLRLLGYDPMDDVRVAGFPGDSLYRTLPVVTGRSALPTWDLAGASPRWMRDRLLHGDVLTTGSSTSPPSALVVGRHAYLVDDVYQSNGTWYVRLYNPWGRDGYQAQGPDDGLITLDWTTYTANFNGYFSAVKR